MNELAERVKAQNQAENERYQRVIAGDETTPPCFTCGQPSTHVTVSITPAGYHAWKCSKHVSKQPHPLWGSDPGWQNAYESIRQARNRARSTTE